MTKFITVALLSAALLSFSITAEGAKGKDKKAKTAANKKAKKAKGGDGFRKAAAKYDVLAKKEKNAEVAKAYKRMAQIKRDAAKKGDAGKWKEISWKEYHALEAKIAKLKGHNKGKKKK